MRTKGEGVNKSENFADITSGSSPRAQLQYAVTQEDGEIVTLRDSVQKSWSRHSLFISFLGRQVLFQNS